MAMTELCVNTKNLSWQPSLRLCFQATELKTFRKIQHGLQIPPLGLQILPLFEDSKIDLDVVDDTTVTDTPPWSQSEPQICLSLTKY